ncbi:MAG: hypothetical protein AAF799_35450 [Myxococcota bacterium]
MCVDNSGQAHVLAVVLALASAALLWGLVGGLKIGLRFKFRALGEVTAGGVAALFLIVHFSSQEGLVASSGSCGGRVLKIYGRVLEDGDPSMGIADALVVVHNADQIQETTTQEHGDYELLLEISPPGEITVWAKKDSVKSVVKRIEFDDEEELSVDLAIQRPVKPARDEVDPSVPVQADTPQGGETGSTGTEPVPDTGATQEVPASTLDSTGEEASSATASTTGALPEPERLFYFIPIRVSNEHGEPIPHALVRIGSRGRHLDKERVNSNGRYEWKVRADELPDELTVWAKKMGYKPGSVSVELPLPEGLAVELELHRSFTPSTPLAPAGKLKN